MVTLLIMFFAWPEAAWAEDYNQLTATEFASSEPLKPIDRALLLELIKLARFNIRFHQEANRHPEWRTLMYAAGRESGTAVSFAGSLIDLKQRVRGFDNPALISKNALRDVVVNTLVGSTISGSASAIELTQNAWVMLAAREQGYSPKASVNFVKNVVATTNKLFEERARISNTNPSQRERLVHQLENALLHRIREQLLFEFQNWSCQSRGQAWRENTFYGLDASQNFVRMSAGIIGLKGFSHPNLGGSVAIISIAANSIATLNPIFAGLAGLSIRKYQFKKLSEELSVEQTIRAPDHSFEELKRLQKGLAMEKQARALDEAIELSDKSERLDAVLNRETKEIEELRRVAQQQTIAGPLIGLTSLPGPIMGTLAFYNYRKERITTNRLLFAGRISGLSGQAFALVQTPTTLIVGMLKNRRLKQRGELPSQLLEQRLNNLDALENEVKQ